jgi:predicted RNA-binding protein with RPS1 domain
MKTNKYGAIISASNDEAEIISIPQSDDSYINNIKKQEAINTMKLMEQQDKNKPYPLKMLKIKKYTYSPN